MYLIGDRVVHPMHGAGIIEAITEERLGGKRSNYYVFRMLPLLEVDMTNNWNQRYRENMERIKSGELMKVAQVVKGLMWRDKRRGLSNGERKMLHNAKQILLSEIVLVCNTTYADAEQNLNQTMMIGANSI